MGVRYHCPKCGEHVQYSPTDDEEDPHASDAWPGCPADQPLSPWSFGVLIGLGVGLLVPVAYMLVQALTQDGL